MPDLMIDLDEDVLDRLKLKAELNGHSLEQELHRITTAAARLTGEEKVAFWRDAH
jgi:plasmid stability protein